MEDNKRLGAVALLRDVPNAVAHVRFTGENGLHEASKA